jgi:DNA-binding IclR family transcriptional regulator
LEQPDDERRWPRPRAPATGQHVLLAVRDGPEAVLVERLSARGAGRVMYRVGGRMPLHSTGVGLVLLAHAPRQVQDEVLAGNLRLEPEHAEVTERELRGRLAAVRREGVAVMSRPQPEPMTSVACPIVGQHRRSEHGTGQDGTSQHGAVVAALSVVARSEQVEPAVLTPAVIAVARAISRAVPAGAE